MTLGQMFAALLILGALLTAATWLDWSAIADASSLDPALRHGTPRRCFATAFLTPLHLYRKPLSLLNDTRRPIL